MVFVPTDPEELSHIPPSRCGIRSFFPPKSLFCNRVNYHGVYFHTVSAVLRCPPPTQLNTFPALIAALGIPWFVVHSPTAAAQKTETDLPLLHTYIWHGTPLLHYPQPGKTLVIDTK